MRCFDHLVSIQWNWHSKGYFIYIDFQYFLKFIQLLDVAFAYFKFSSLFIFLLQFLDRFFVCIIKLRYQVSFFCFLVIGVRLSIYCYYVFSLSFCLKVSYICYYFEKLVVVLLLISFSMLPVLIFRYHFRHTLMFTTCADRVIAIQFCYYLLLLFALQF